MKYDCETAAEKKRVGIYACTLLAIGNGKLGTCIYIFCYHEYIELMFVCVYTHMYFAVELNWLVVSYSRYML